jgi:5-formyltetrahydrofolate cyclo-ligase
MCLVSQVRHDKAALRSQLLAARSRLSADQRTAAGRLIRDALLSLPEVQMAGTVAAYYSVGAEPDTRGLVYALWKRGTYVLLPLLRDDADLDWASYEGPDSLVPGPRGLREPGEPPRGVEAVARADVVLAPALAVDRAGNRLGRGGGSFDRALARVGPLIPVIAPLYDGELIDRVPAEPHDVPVRAVVRPGRGITSLPVLARGGRPPRNPPLRFAPRCGTRRSIARPEGLTAPRGPSDRGSAAVFAVWPGDDLGLPFPAPVAGPGISGLPAWLDMLSSRISRVLT